LQNLVSTKTKFVWSSVKNLKDRGIGLSHDYPKEIDDIHAKLYPVLRKAKREKQQAFFKVDKLIINGQVYKGKETDNLPCYGLIMSSNSQADGELQSVNARQMDNLRNCVYILCCYSCKSRIVLVSLAVFFLFTGICSFLSLDYVAFANKLLFNRTYFLLLSITFIYDFGFASTFVIPKYFIVTLPFVSLLLLQSH